MVLLVLNTQEDEWRKPSSMWKPWSRRWTLSAEERAFHGGNWLQRLALASQHSRECNRGRGLMLTLLPLSSVGWECPLRDSSGVKVQNQERQKSPTRWQWYRRISAVGKKCRRKRCRQSAN